MIRRTEAYANIILAHANNRSNSMHFRRRPIMYPSADISLRYDGDIPHHRDPGDRTASSGGN